MSGAEMSDDVAVRSVLHPLLSRSTSGVAWVVLRAQT